MDKFSVSCINCEGEFSATQITDDLWKCSNCGYMTDSESGRITNETEKEDYRKLYIGAKIAGLVDEPDVPREHDYHSEWRI
jgi:ribosomal protein L37AE/L43A